MKVRRWEEKGGKKGRRWFERKEVSGKAGVCRWAEREGVLHAGKRVVMRPN
jgi:hypothetical protein